MTSSNRSSAKLAPLLSSQDMDWATPQAFYDALDAEFGFTVDVCASAWNAKHEHFWTVDDDALSLSPGPARLAL